MNERIVVSLSQKIEIKNIISKFIIMKKFFSLIVMAALSACLVSCGSDKEDQKPPVEASVFSSVKVDISLKFTEATLNMANIVLSLPNSEGKIVRESVLKPEWEKTLIINKPISDFDFQINITKMPVIDTSDENKTLSTREDGTKYALLGLSERKLIFKACDQNGVEFSSRFEVASSLDKEEVELDEIDKFFEKYASTPYYSLGVVYDKNGKPSLKIQ